MVSWTAICFADETNVCEQCHPFETQTFRLSAMSRAAQTTGFLTEWQRENKNTACLDCHAPSSEKGLGCIDCHGSESHVSEPRRQEGICARCHNAPLENTYRHFETRPISLVEKRCIDCHIRPSPSGVDHQFPGINDYTLRQSSIFLRWIIHKGEPLTIDILLQNRTAHAIPGGTSGRALWLVIRYQENAWMPLRRFGWFQDKDRRWFDFSFTTGTSQLSFPLDRIFKEVQYVKVGLWLQTTTGELNIGSQSGFWLDGNPKILE